MSPLTKIFVVLLVILSLLLSAATVSFVYTQQDLATANQGLQQKASSLEASVAQARSLAEQERLAFTEQSGVLQGELTRVRQSLATAEAALANERLRADKAEAQAAAAVQLSTAQSTRIESLLGLLDKSYSELATVKAAGDENAQRRAQAEAVVDSLTAELGITRSQLRFVQEQLTEEKRRNDRAEALLRQFNIPTETVTAQIAPDVRAVVRSVRTVNGRQYAEISVGSRADVRPGMEFNVVDRATGAFLGTLIIELVEPNQAVGRVEGTRAAEVQVGNEVRTQL